jgi:signal transduction histidine kinase
VAFYYPIIKTSVPIIITEFDYFSVIIVLITCPLLKIILMYGKMEKWKNGRMEKWKNGKIMTIIHPRIIKNLSNIINSQTPKVLLLKFAITIFAAEILVMLVLSIIPPMSTYPEALADAIMLSLLISPALYCWIYRPINKYVKKLEKLNESLDCSLREQLRTYKELQNAQQQIIESEKLASLGLLTAGISHEIRGPVNYIESNLQSFNDYTTNIFRLIATYEDTHAILGKDHEFMDQLDELREEIDIAYIKNDTPELINQSIQGIERIKSIIQNFKDFSRHSTDEWELSDIHECIESTLQIVWNELKYKTTVIKEYAELPEIECIASELNQVILNLLVNAANAIENNGTITIKTGCEQNNIWFSIADTGSGMTAEQKARIFEPFFTTKARGEGTGLGLSISLGIIEKHNGKVIVDSTLKKGSVFRILLPIKHKITQA